MLGEKYGQAEAKAGLMPLRFVTSGSVGDGKSSLIRALFSEEGAASKAEAGLGMGLPDEGLYRSFATAKRQFQVADAPGSAAQTRITAAAASTADLAVILVDVRKGLLTQTRRHSYLVKLFGIKQVVLAVNKMDLVNYDQDRFEEVATAFRTFADEIGLLDVRAIPVSATAGDNVAAASESTPWYRGPALLEVLESAPAAVERGDLALRFPVETVEDASSGGTLCKGTLVSGRVRPGDAVMVCPMEKSSKVARILGADGELEEAASGQSVSLELADKIDLGSGDVIAAAEEPAQQTDQFAAHLLWMHEDAMLPERQYLIQIGTRSATAVVTDLRYRVNVKTLEKMAAKKLKQNEVAYCNFSLDQPIAFDPYGENRETGGFILIDRFTEETVGAGLIEFGLRRATNLTWHDTAVEKSTRAKQKGQTPCILWFTGLSGSGKSTVANRIEQKLQALGRHTYLLDGDNVRHGLNRDLGFTDQDRVENIRRVGEVAKLFVDAGTVVLVSFISPFRSERQMARELVDGQEFIEVFMDTPLEVCEERDPKGLYKRARAGQIKNFTGIDSDYEPPEEAEIVLRGDRHEVDQLADQVIAYLKNGGYV